MSEKNAEKRSPRLITGKGRESSAEKHATSQSKGIKATSRSPPDSKRKREEKEEEKTSDRIVPEKHDESSFERYPSIKEETIRKLKAKGITSLFPIQSSCYKRIYDREDIIARDLTGSGKTLAFALPIVEKFRDRGYFKRRNPDLLAIILAPTRELAQQVSTVLKDLKHSESEYSVLTVYGGVPIDE